MKRIILVALLASVAACSKPAPAPEATAEASAEATPAAVAGPVAADGKSSVGTFKVTTDKGVFMEEDKADGTYVTKQDGKVIETGKWVQKSPSEFCYTKDEKDAKEVCNTEQVDEKGVWTSKNAEGKISTVERVG
jgi:hypothetical protein